MAADSANDLELSLKKRARRRLVGAIALVLLMVIALPMILQDRSSSVPQEAIKITMPEDVIQPESESTAVNETAQVESDTEVAMTQPQSAIDLPAVENPQVESKVADPIPLIEPKQAKVEVKPVEANPLEEKVEVKQEPKKVKPIPAKPVEKKPVENKQLEDKAKATANASFTIQVGVFSDPENVKQLQAKLKQVGLASRTEKINTPKGEKIRLRAGTFSSRQEAAYALIKIQAADLTGMVISNN